eukprot:1153557-Pyramimonas_sp.AAC.1
MLTFLGQGGGCIASPPVLNLCWGGIPQRAGRSGDRATQVRKSETLRLPGATPCSQYMFHKSPTIHV